MKYVNGFAMSYGDVLQNQCYVLRKNFGIVMCRCRFTKQYNARRLKILEN